MLAHWFTGFRVLHGVLLAFAAVGFFIFWIRTRFWLPKYAHILAAIGLAVGIWCVSNVPDDAPISRHGPGVKFLEALILPAMVYFFFVFYGGQQEAFRSKSKNATEIADIVERFLNGASCIRRSGMILSNAGTRMHIWSHTEKDATSWIH